MTPTEDYLPMAVTEDYLPMAARSSVGGCGRMILKHHPVIGRTEN